jgi:hypothetical protein
MGIQKGCRMTSPEYDRLEQIKIKLAIAQIIPEGAYYKNIIIALADTLKDMIYNAVAEDNFRGQSKPDGEK